MIAKTVELDQRRIEIAEIIVGGFDERVEIQPNTREGRTPTDPHGSHDVRGIAGCNLRSQHVIGLRVVDDLQHQFDVVLGSIKLRNDFLLRLDDRFIGARTETDVPTNFDLREGSTHQQGKQKYDSFHTATFPLQHPNLHKVPFGLHAMEVRGFRRSRSFRTLHARLQQSMVQILATDCLMTSLGSNLLLTTSVSPSCKEFKAILAAA